ncbi:unnamed protein product [Miscanthus lutarioriparius]|uniref:Peptidyl-prolyl cis-trans isomerase n=1 Tax=Miscanthus lutarioriparius TaxID=422564 RepID=A0A811S0P7_9POAL|nr:unnamed protein product [Miscanthus lutarioriparius]
MSVLIVTSVGDISVDLHTDLCPFTTKNFLKLCKMKYYNGCLFHDVKKDFLAQTGDPTGTGTGGDSVYKHSKPGTVTMASAGENCNASQFYITLRDDLDYLDDKHTVFGMVAEGFDTLLKINEAYVDDKGRPFKNIRIKHTYVLDDPFDEPPQLAELIPDNSPKGKPRDEIGEERLEDNYVRSDETAAPEKLEEMIRAKEAHTNAVALQIMGDIPDAEIKPPDNVLFVRPINPVTQVTSLELFGGTIDEDLYTIFSRFGTVTSAEIIRDKKTGHSLDGCFRCGAPRHLARDCDKMVARKTKASERQKHKAQWKLRSMKNLEKNQSDWKGSWHGKGETIRTEGVKVPDPSRKGEDDEDYSQRGKSDGERRQKSPKSRHGRWWITRETGERN